MTQHIDVIRDLRVLRGWDSLADRKRAVDAVGPDLDKADAWLRERSTRSVHVRTSSVTLSEVTTGRHPQARAHDPERDGDGS